MRFYQPYFIWFCATIYLLKLLAHYEKEFVNTLYVQPLQVHFCLFFSQINSTMTVDGLDYYVTTNYGEELYDSCKDVKFGTLNTRAMDFIGAGAKTYKGKIETLFCCWVSSLNGNYASCTPS